jgi:hypothetical protein
MDDEGFDPGKDLFREEQSRALNSWLRANGYDPRMFTPSGDSRWRNFSSDSR